MTDEQPAYRALWWLHPAYLEGAPGPWIPPSRFTDDPIADDFFGCAGVGHIDGLQNVLLHVGRHGYRHHVSATRGHVLEPVRDALGHYLGFDVEVPQNDRLET